MAQHNDLGKWGEDKAEEYLRSKGWYILARDWHYGHKDLDIIAVDEEDTTILVVEVKTRSNEELEYADDAVDLQKKNNILQSVAAFLRQNRLSQHTVRYDVISVIGTDDSNFTLRHTENAFDVLSNFLYKEQRRKSSYYSRKHRPGMW